MNGVNLISAARRSAKARRVRRTFWVRAGGIYATVLALAGLGLRISTPGVDLAPQIEQTTQGIDKAKKEAAAKRVQLARVQREREAGRAVTEQPDWSLVMALLGEIRGGDTVLESCELAAATDAAATGAHAPGKVAPATETRSPSGGRFVLNLSGLAVSQQAVSEFVLSLERCKLFDRVSMVETKARPYGSEQVTAFRVQCDLHDRSGPLAPAVVSAGEGVAK
jgi:hypothetical protein